MISTSKSSAPNISNTHCVGSGQPKLQQAHASHIWLKMRAFGHYKLATFRKACERGMVCSSTPEFANHAANLHLPSETAAWLQMRCATNASRTATYTSVSCQLRIDTDVYMHAEPSRIETTDLQSPDSRRGSRSSRTFTPLCILIGMRLVQHTHHPNHIPKTIIKFTALWWHSWQLPQNLECPLAHWAHILPVYSGAQTGLGGAYKLAAPLLQCSSSSHSNICVRN